MSADLAARRAAAASVLADYNRELRTAPLSRPPGREWMLRLATELESLLTALDDGDAVSEDAGKLAAIRAVLAAFDWEHDDRQYALVDQLVKGTVGYADEYLPGPRRKLTDAQARQIRDRCFYDDEKQRDVAAEFGVSPSTVSDIATGKTWGWLE